MTRSVSILTSQASIVCLEFDASCLFSADLVIARSVVKGSPYLRVPCPFQHWQLRL